MIELKKQKETKKIEAAAIYLDKDGLAVADSKKENGEDIFMSSIGIRETFCYSNCKYLEPKEKDQKKGECHKCLRLNKILHHLGHHPQLPKLQQCDYTLSEYTKEQHGIKKPQTHDAMG